VSHRELYTDILSMYVILILRSCRRKQNVSNFLNDRSKMDRINPKLREGSERRISFLNFARSLNGLSFEQKRTESDQTHLMIEAKINRFNSSFSESNQSEPNKLKSCAQINLVKRTFFYLKFASHLLALAQAAQLIVLGD